MYQTLPLSPSHGSIPPEKQRLRSGFPPRELKPPSDDPSLPVELANGERVSVDVIGPVKGVASDSAGLRAEAGSASSGGSGEGAQGGSGSGRGGIKSGEEQAQQCKLTCCSGLLATAQGHNGRTSPRHCLS